MKTKNLIPVVRTKDDFSVNFDLKASSFHLPAKLLIDCFVWRGSGKIKGWDLTLLSADCIFVGSARCLNTWYFLPVCPVSLSPNINSFQRLGLASNS